MVSDVVEDTWQGRDMSKESLLCFCHECVISELAGVSVLVHSDKVTSEYRPRESPEQ